MLIFAWFLIALCVIINITYKHLNRSANYVHKSYYTRDNIMPHALLSLYSTLYQDTIQWTIRHFRQPITHKWEHKKQKRKPYNFSNFSILTILFTNPYIDCSNSNYKNRTIVRKTVPYSTSFEKLNSNEIWRRHAHISLSYKFSSV